MMAEPIQKKKRSKKLQEALNGLAPENAFKELFDRAREKLKQAEQFKRDAITTLAKELEDEGVLKYKISGLITQELKDYVSAQYVRRCLDPELKNLQKSNNESNIASDIGNLSSQNETETETITTDSNDATEQEPTVEEIETEQEAVPEAVYQMDPATYRSEDLEQYDKPFLCEIIRYLENKLAQQGKQDMWNRAMQRRKEKSEHQLE